LIAIRSPKELDLLREANRIAADVLKRVAEMVRPGVSTTELDQEAEELIRAMEAAPSFKGYKGYPSSICASIDEQVVHGIPSERRLVEGEIVSIDIGTNYRGYCGDAAVTVPVGEVGLEKRRLMEATRRALDSGVEAARAGNRVADISRAVQTEVELNGFSVIRQFVGHGIGTSPHEDPQVPNFVSDSSGPQLRAGMVLSIEPMVSASSAEVEILEDMWTAVTVDRQPAAHFEHTVAVRDGGPEILTLCRGETTARREQATERAVGTRYGERTSD
jgi:methionyl aminopeptidase